MAKKYNSIATKIHPITIASITIFVVVIVALLFAIQPSKESRFYQSYKSQEYTFQELFDSNKMDENHNFKFVNHIDDQWFGLQKGLSSIAARNEVTIVFFGNPSNQNSFSQIGNVHARLFGAPRASVEPSVLYTELGNLVSLYHYEVSSTNLAGVIETLNERYETEIVASQLPLLVVFVAGEIVDYTTLSSSNVPQELRVFYRDIYESEAVAPLLN